jgi:predicted nucleic acid-binding protein
VRGFILDVNHVSAHFNKVPTFMERYRLFPPDTQWRVCSVTLGEIEAGHQMSVSGDLTKRDAYARFVIDEYAYNAVEITARTRVYYASIIRRIWNTVPPPKSKLQTEKHLVNNGVDINDIWMVSSAWEHGLKLLTSDALTSIRNILDVSEVEFDCWI